MYKVNLLIIIIDFKCIVIQFPILSYSIHQYNNFQVNLVKKSTLHSIHHLIYILYILVFKNVSYKISFVFLMFKSLISAT